jgi:hypothetical protein
MIPPRLQGRKPISPPPPPQGRKPFQTKVQKIKQAIQIISQQTKPQDSLPDQKSVDALIGYLTTQTTPLPGAPPVVQKPFPPVTQLQLQKKFLQFLKKIKQQSQKRKTTPPLNPQAAASTIKVLQQKVKQQTQKSKQQVPSPPPMPPMPPMPAMPPQGKRQVSSGPRPSIPMPPMPPKMTPAMIPQGRRSMS